MMWIFGHWIFTHSVVFLVGMYLGWNHFLQPAWIRAKTRTMTTWLNNNLMTYLTLRNVMWVSALLAAIANSHMMRGAKGWLALIKNSLLATSLFLLSFVGDVKDFTTKTKDINKTEEPKEGDNKDA